MKDQQNIQRFEFSFKKEFLNPVIFLIVDNEIGNRIAFYPQSPKDKNFDIFNRLYQEIKGFEKVSIEYFNTNSIFGIELIIDNGDHCVKLILHDETNRKLVFRACGFDQVTRYINYME